MRIIHIGGTVDQYINSDHIIRVTPYYMDRTKEEKYYNVVLTHDSIQVYQKRDMSRDSFISKWTNMVKINDMTEDQAKKTLKIIIAKLNELDNDDFFGTEGWRHFFGLDD